MPLTPLSGGGAGKSFAASFKEGLVHCRAQVAAYGSCLKATLPGVEKGACEREFVALRTCFFASVRWFG
jgi:hypothetical protein